MKTEDTAQIIALLTEREKLLNTSEMIGRLEIDDELLIGVGPHMTHLSGKPMESVVPYIRTAINNRAVEIQETLATLGVTLS